MNEIIAALFILAMFVLSVGGMEYERTDSTGYTYPSLIYIEPETTADKVYELIANDPKGFIDWLYSHYYVLDMEKWIRIDEDTYIKK